MVALFSCVYEQMNECPLLAESSHSDKSNKETLASCWGRARVSGRDLIKSSKGIVADIRPKFIWDK
jgi:hypothetical protein